MGKTQNIGICPHTHMGITQTPALLSASSFSLSPPTIFSLPVAQASWGGKQRHELANLNDAILTLSSPLPLSSLPTVRARRPLAKRRDPLSYLRTRCLHDSRELRAVTRLALRLTVAATSIVKRHPLRDRELRPQRTGMGCRIGTRAGVCQMRRVVRAAHEQQRVDGVHFRLLAGHAQDTHRPLRLAGRGRRWCTDIGEGVGDLDFCLGPEHGRRRAPRC